MSAQSHVGLVVVGMGGVGSSLLAGVLASRSHLVHPLGSLAEPLRARAPLAELSDLTLGAFELKDDDAFRAATRAGLISRSLLDELRPDLRRIKSMLGARQAPTRRHLADAFAEDLRGFLAHHHCSRGVVVCTLPGVRTIPARVGFSADEVWNALEQSADWVTPGLVYAAAAAQAGCAFVAAGRDAAMTVPGLPQLFEERGAAIAGSGLIGPDALLRETVAQVLAAESMPLNGAASLSTRAEERGTRLWGGPDRTSEMALGGAWAGGAFELSIELRGQVALYHAARALDAALFVELASRAGRTGAQQWMNALFTTPLTVSGPRVASAPTLLAQRAEMMAELPSLAAELSKNAVAM